MRRRPVAVVVAVDVVEMPLSQQPVSIAGEEQLSPLDLRSANPQELAAHHKGGRPADGYYQYNTNVVFDEAGRLLVKYYKSHEFPNLRKAYDAVSEPSEVTYRPSFVVEFGIFTCFDIMFPDPAVRLRKRGVTHFLYPVEQGQLGEDTIIERWSRQQKAVLLSWA